MSESAVIAWERQQLAGNRVRHARYLQSARLDTTASVRVVTRDDSATPPLQIDTVGEFQAYATRAEAKAAALQAQAEGQA